MEIEPYLRSENFMLFVDETLRHNAENLVDTFLATETAVKKSQLRPIPNAVQVGGMNELAKLIRNQSSKNTRKENKAFWDFLFKHISNASAQNDSLYAIVREHLDQQGFIEDEQAAAEDKKLRNKLKKQNKQFIDQAIDTLLPVYFEHFNCHYYYRTAG